MNSNTKVNTQQRATTSRGNAQTPFNFEKTLQISH